MQSWACAQGGEEGVRGPLLGCGVNPHMGSKCFSVACHFHSGKRKRDVEDLAFSQSLLPGVWLYTSGGLTAPRVGIGIRFSGTEGKRPASTLLLKASWTKKSEGWNQQDMSRERGCGSPPAPNTHRRHTATGTYGNTSPHSDTGCDVRMACCRERLVETDATP